METKINAFSLFTPVYPYTKDIKKDTSQTKHIPLDMEYKLDWNDTQSVNHIKDLIHSLLCQSLEGITEEDIFSMFNLPFEIIENLRFGQLSSICSINIDRFGRRSYHYPENKINNYNDKQLDQETKIILSTLTKDELNTLKSKLNNDIKDNNSEYDPQLCVYLSNIINDTQQNENKEDKQESEKLETKEYDVFNTINDYNDKNLQKDTKIIVSSLTKDELNKLKSKLDNDMKQNNSEYDGQLYEYLSNIINDNDKDNIDILENKTDLKNTDITEQVETKLDEILQQQTKILISSLTSEELNQLKYKLDEDIKQNNGEYDGQLYEYLSNIINDTQKEVKMDVISTDKKEEIESKMDSKMDKVLNVISNYNDIKLKEETQRLISSLTVYELNQLKTKLDTDIKENNTRNDGQLYEYLTNIINEIEQDSNIEKKELETNVDKASNAISNYNDEKLQQDTKHLISSLTKEELNKLKTKLDTDIKENNTRNDGQLYEYLLNIINDKRDNNMVKVQTDLQNDKDVKQETKHLILSLTNEELSELKTKLDEDMKQNTGEYDSQLYEYLSNIINETAKDFNMDMVNIQMDLKNEITYKLQDIIQRKDEEIQGIIAINNEQNKLIKSLSERNVNSVDAYDTDINQCLKITNKLVNNLIKSFDIKYNINNINEMGENNINNLVDINSEFNNELNGYKKVLKTIGICSNKLNNSIDNIKGYINDKYIPNENDYKQWKLNDILLWIKVLENGRYIKYLDVLSIGFKESEILNGEILCDLNTADLAVTPFNIKKFRDRRDLIKNFKRLNGQ